MLLRGILNFVVDIMQIFGLAALVVTLLGFVL